MYNSLIQEKQERFQRSGVTSNSQGDYQRLRPKTDSTTLTLKPVLIMHNDFNVYKCILLCSQHEST